MLSMQSRRKHESNFFLYVPVLLCQNLGEASVVARVWPVYLLVTPAVHHLGPESFHRSSRNLG